MTRDEAHAILGLDPGASEEHVRAAFHKAAFWCHPDRNPGNRVAAETFRRIAHAYELLRSPAGAWDGADDPGGPHGRRSAAERAADEWAAAAEHAAAERAAAERAAAERAERERASTRRRWLVVVSGTAVGLAMLAPQLAPEPGASAATLAPAVSGPELAAALPERAPGEAGRDAAQPLDAVEVAELARLVAPDGTGAGSAPAYRATIKASGVWRTGGADRLAAVVALEPDEASPGAEGACELVLATRTARGGLRRTAAAPVPEHACAARAFTSLQTRGFAFDAGRELLGVHVSELHQGYGTLSLALFRLDGEALTRVLALESEVVPDAPRLERVETEADGAGPSRVVVRFRAPDGAELPTHVYAWNGSAYVASEPRAAAKADGGAAPHAPPATGACPDVAREPEPSADGAARPPASGAQAGDGETRSHAAAVPSAAPGDVRDP